MPRSGVALAIAVAVLGGGCSTTKQYVQDMKAAAGWREIAATPVGIDVMRPGSGAALHLHVKYESGMVRAASWEPQHDVSWLEESPPCRLEPIATLRKGSGTASLGVLGRGRRAYSQEIGWFEDGPETDRRAWLALVEESLTSGMRTTTTSGDAVAKRVWIKQPNEAQPAAVVLRAFLLPIPIACDLAYDGLVVASVLLLVASVGAFLPAWVYIARGP